MITKEKFEDFKNNDFSMLPMVREVVSPDDNPLSLFEKISDKKIISYLNPLKVETSGLNTQLLVLVAWILSRHMGT